MTTTMHKLPKRSARFGVGKDIGGAAYLQRTYEDKLGSVLVTAKRKLPDDFDYHIVKYNYRTNAVSFVECGDFDTAPEPTVGEIVTVDSAGNVRRRRQPRDPEIYHHKWLFVAEDYKGFDVEASRRRSLAWMQLCGIDRRRIGRTSYWREFVIPQLNDLEAPIYKSERRLASDSHSASAEVRAADRRFAKATTAEAKRVARHKTAIRRPSFSLPIKCLLRDGLLDASKTLFDYGCGHGQDLNLLRDMDVHCDGWDPAFRPEATKNRAEVVNIGYVINVVENARERSAALRGAWDLCEELLVVAAQVEFAAPDKQQTEFADGVLTSRGTFQKYYNQHELRSYLESELGGDAIPAAPGVFYVFKGESAKQRFIATRYHRRISVPRRRISELLFEQNQDLLEPLMQTVTALGRLPGPEELPEAMEVVERLGSLKRAFALIRRVTDEQPWEDIAQKRAEDLMVYLALSRFQRRPKLSQLPLSIQRDIKAFLGSYRAACVRADVLLFRAGDPEAIDEACQRAEVGQLVDNALIIHRSALDYLQPILRIYEGCARSLVGEIDEANVIKLHRFSGKVSYIVYSDFDKNPHPPMKLRVKVTLPTLSIDLFDYSTWRDPPILSRKEQLLHNTHEL